MLNKFQDILLADKSLNPRHIPHYMRWVRECYRFFNFLQLSICLPNRSDCIYPI